MAPRTCIVLPALPMAERTGCLLSGYSCYRKIRSQEDQAARNLSPFSREHQCKRAVRKNGEVVDVTVQVAWFCLCSPWSSFVLKMLSLGFI